MTSQQSLRESWRVTSSVETNRGGIWQQPAEKYRKEKSNQGEIQRQDKHMLTPCAYGLYRKPINVTNITPRKFIEIYRARREQLKNFF
jgi:hypothetical protein